MTATPEAQAAVERVTAALAGYDALLTKRPECWPGDEFGKGGGAEYVADLTTVLSAFAEAQTVLAENHQALLDADEAHQNLSAAFATSETRAATAEGERDAMRDEVRKLNLALYAVGVQLNNNRIPRQSRILNALEVLDVLNHQQEGSRDHG